MYKTNIKIYWDRLQAGRIILHFKDMLDTALFKLYAIIIKVFGNYAATMSWIFRIKLIDPIIAHIHKFHYYSLNPKTIRVDFSVHNLEHIMKINIKQLPFHTFF